MMQMENRQRIRLDVYKRQEEDTQQYVIAEGTQNTAVPLVREQDILDVGILRPGQSVTGMLQLGIAPSDERCV